MRTLPIALALCSSLLSPALAAPRDATPANRPATLRVTSTAFAAQQSIPAEYTCDGAQAAPPLAWSRVPAQTRSIALLVEDPDAAGGAFTHWLITGLSPEVSALAAGGALPTGAVAAKNDKGEVGYAAICPPTGRHRYHFRVYALETTIPPPGSKDDFLASIDGHVLAQGELVATYQKVQPATPKVSAR